jgi:long-chain acyl-CoA synthetase
MINIDPEVVGNWAERRSVSYTGYTDLAQNPAVYALVLDEVRHTNETLTPTQRVRRFTLLHKELDADDAEITRTRKLRRRFIHDRYRDIIEALYDVTARDATVRVSVTYEDGRTSEVARVVHLEDVPHA